jgi:hypothetical protein
MEFILAALSSYWILAALFVIALSTEYYDNYVATAFFVAVGLLLLLTVHALPYWILLAYIPTGILWSIWRWRVHCKECADLAKDGKLRKSGGSWTEAGKVSVEDSRRFLIAATDLKENLDRVVSWVICFPASMVERAFSDIIHMIKVVITEWLAKVYNSSTKSALETFDKK